MPACGSCGKTLDIVGNQVGRRETCPGCEAELHACIHCRHFDEGVAKKCKEPFSEVPDDLEGANFCEYFQIGEGGKRGGAPKADLLSAAELLFKKR
jgi:hypothetical protein